MAKDANVAVEMQLAVASVHPPLSCAELRRICDPASIPFDSTADIEPLHGVIGQDTAMEALRYGLQVRAPGQNIFVRGLTGTGRMTLLSRLLEEIRLECPLAQDRCYVHNFADPDRPRLISLPRGTGSEFRYRVEEMVAFVTDQLESALEANNVQMRRTSVEQETQRRIEKLVEPFEKSLGKHGLALASVQVGPIAQAALFPLLEGKTISPEEWDQMRSQGKVSEKQDAAFRKKHDDMQPKLREVMHEVNELRRALTERVEALRVDTARSLLMQLVGKITAAFPEPEVATFLDELVDDASRTTIEKGADSPSKYRVNVLLTHGRDSDCAVVVEDTPTVRNLLGAVDVRWERGEGGHTDHMLIRAGSILRADGGYLILDARDLLRDPRPWHALVRTLRTGRLEIHSGENASGTWGPSLKPAPIAVNVKVILLGNAETYHALDEMDPDFPHLFKILADFDSEIVRDQTAIEQYGAVLARVVKEHRYPAFDRTAVAAMVEHGARIAGRSDRLTTRFGRLVDIAHESAFVTRDRGAKSVTGKDVREAIRRSKRRAGLPSKQFQEMLGDGTIQVATTGKAVGEVNGLAVSHLGPLTFGFPTRITATIGPGSAGVINIEREAELSGSIHTKGFYILGGLLRYLLRTGHPLAFHASIAFEQTYGGIDGDSASGAEMCCLLSALTDVPLRQDIAMTGAIDQVGNILAVGAANEKIEGFFDTCCRAGLTGQEGVIIPQANARDLMLRHDVVDACRAGKFKVYAVQRIHEALEILTGVAAGTTGEDGYYPDNTILGGAVIRAFEYWVRASQTPDASTVLDATAEEAELEAD